MRENREQNERDDRVNKVRLSYIFLKWRVRFIKIELGSI